MASPGVPEQRPIRRAPDVRKQRKECQTRGEEKHRPGEKARSSGPGSRLTTRGEEGGGSNCAKFHPVESLRKTNHHRKWPSLHTPGQPYSQTPRLFGPVTEAGIRLKTSQERKSGWGIIGETASKSSSAFVSFRRESVKNSYCINVFKGPKEQLTGGAETGLLA